MDRALLLLLNGTPPAVVANLGDLAMATDAQANADQEDATAADAVAMAW